MKNSFLPRNLTASAATAAAALVLLLCSGVAQAQTTKTIKGDFRSTDGNSGTYLTTLAINGDTRTDTVVYTRSSDQETSTDITTSTKNADKSRTVSFSHTDYGSTAEFTSHKTIDKFKGGFSGSGTYMTAAGTTGTLTSLETNAAGVATATVTYTSSTGKITTNLRLEEDAPGFVAIKSLSLDSDGNTTATVTTRYVTSVD